MIAIAVAGPLLAKPYVLKPGDLLRIEVIEDTSLNRNALILPDGTIAFPMVGLVQAAGLTLSQVRKELTTGLAPNFAQKPSLHVAVAAVAQRKSQTARARTVVPSKAKDKSISVFGMGELSRPGKLQVAPDTTLLQFLSQAGGTTAYAALKRVQIRRTDPVKGSVISYQVNLKQLMRDGSGKSFLLAPGDVVIIPERKLFE